MDSGLKWKSFIYYQENEVQLQTSWDSREAFTLTGTIKLSSEEILLSRYLSQMYKFSWLIAEHCSPPFGPKWQNVGILALIGHQRQKGQASGDFTSNRCMFTLGLALILLTHLGSCYLSFAESYTVTNSKTATLFCSKESSRLGGFDALLCMLFAQRAFTLSFCGSSARVIFTRPHG